MMVLVLASGTEDAWKKAVAAVMTKGALLKTEDGDETREIMGLNVRISNPTQGKENVPDEYPFKGHALQDYIDQLMTHENKWNFEYTYGERIWNWDGKVNQVEDAISRLSSNMNSRRATCDLAIPFKDTVSNDPPCMRIVDFKIRDIKMAPMLPASKKLFMTVLFRSHDIFGASYANWIALANLQKYVATQISEKSGVNVIPGEIHNYSISAHIYGRDFEVAKKVTDSL